MNHLVSAMLYMVSAIGWLFLTGYLYNQDYPVENAYLPIAISVFCASMVLICAAQVVVTYLNWMSKNKPYKPTSAEIQAAHKKKVLTLTQKKEKPWYEQF